MKKCEDCKWFVYSKCQQGEELEDCESFERIEIEYDDEDYYAMIFDDLANEDCYYEDCW